jgi:phenylacetate-CoA oxygenase PaaI subunit|tara:strand:- start:1126 stop:1932 length:807 start_codon:yes stop_codon:yes gene_type:complete
VTLISNPEDLGADERQSLANWLTAMSDTKHLLGLRYAEWCTGGPELEANIAASAMAQFELGHARVLRGVLSDLPEDPRDASRATDRSTWFSLGALDRPFTGWVDLVIGNALVDTLLTVNMRSALAGNYHPLTQRLRKVLAEEEYHSVHADAWIKRLASGPGETVERLNQMFNRVWPQCIAWFGPNSGNGLDELHDVGVLADSAADLRNSYIESVLPMFDGGSIRPTSDVEINWDGWNKAGRRHGVPVFEDDCFAMITGANNRTPGVGD